MSHNTAPVYTAAPVSSASIVIRTLLVLAGLFALAWLCSACGGTIEQAPSGDAPTGFECGAIETGLYGSHTYGIYNSAVEKCAALGGECLPSDATQADGPVFCTMPSKVYADVADCPPAWQDCASAEGHTGVDSEPSQGVTHWVATCGEKNEECLVVLAK